MNDMEIFGRKLIGTPEFRFRSWGNVIQYDNRPKFFGDPLVELRKIFKEKKSRRTGCAIGYIGYDTVRLWEDIGNNAVKDIDLPDIYLLFYENPVMFEAPPRTSRAYSMSCHQLFKPTISKEAFIEMVLKAKEYISAGDIYQANLSHRLEADCDIDGRTLYERLREINPSPFAGYMNLEGLEIISCSPERLVRVTGNIMETRPIAGTYPRGRGIKEDIENAANLVLNPKERAEHIMLLDLERNDLGRVCEYGSVDVNECMVVETYSHVHHIVSNVKGNVRDGVDQIDILKAVFPGGTITGCPKIRCMQIIDELEPVRRNLYTGSIGWIGYNGDMDLNIIIRTILKIGNKLYLQAGAGIVADSIPEREYNETLYKAAALLEAVMFEAPPRTCIDIGHGRDPKVQALSGRGPASTIGSTITGVAGYGFDSLS